MRSTHPPGMGVSGADTWAKGNWVGNATNTKKEQQLTSQAKISP